MAGQALRRVVKPFAVEIRTSGRKLKSKAANGPTWPQLDDQPDVVWPEILAEPSVEPYRDPRKPSQIRLVQAEDQPAAAPEPIGAEKTAARPAGRILRVIDEAPVVAESVRDKHTKPAKRTKRSEPVLPVEPQAIEFVVMSPPAIDTRAVAVTLVLRSGKARLTRNDFKRGQRWKARLPASVHRAKRRHHLA